MGKYITDIEQLYASLSGLFGSLDKYPELREPVLNSGLVLEMVYTDPSGQICVDTSKGKVDVYTGEWPADVEPQVKLMLTSDVAHQFWLGKINFMFAMAKGQIKTSGNMGAMLKLVPLLGPLFDAYKDYLRNNGMEDMIF